MDLSSSDDEDDIKKVDQSDEEASYEEKDSDLDIAAQGEEEEE